MAKPTHAPLALALALALPLALPLVVIAGPALAQPQAAPGPAAAAAPTAAKEAAAPKPLTDQTVTAADVAATPLNDLNLQKKAIPPLLLAAETNPYDLAGLRRCADLQRAVAALDAVLGADLDVAERKPEKVTPGHVAKAVVSSFIPFEGVIRALSGASAHDRAVQDAVYAGGVRRGFLKGVGQARGCRYPARSAFGAQAALRGATPAGTAAAAVPPARANAAGRVRFESRPVVQPVHR